MVTTLVRKHALTDGIDYAKSKAYGMGCEVNPVMLGCLSCPLPVCKYDDPGVKQRQITEQTARRATEACRLYAAGIRVPDIATRLGMSTRVIHRYVQGIDLRRAR